MLLKDRFLRQILNEAYTIIGCIHSWRYQNYLCCLFVILDMNIQYYYENKLDRYLYIL